MKRPGRANKKETKTNLSLRKKGETKTCIEISSTYNTEQLRLITCLLLVKNISSQSYKSASTDGSAMILAGIESDRSFCGIPLLPRRSLYSNVPVEIKKINASESKILQV